MTLSSLFTAVALGVVVGFCGGWSVPAGRRLPFWVPLAVAMCAAMLGSVIAGIAGIDTSGVTPVELVLQGIFAAAAVSLVAGTAERRTPGHRYDPGGSR
ncbi:GlsB/YeaQ/YmgE family stress response membrane protein [Nucisporomicrobium flavum]|uniref:GlsB/YeaQ/YmgE family stress response membrane protein n=1 Tax=Nucisporomicrobium flavum TaxID=2785915 RepID=UPI0018F66AE4|nr:GlsB/YeaQ/YmgE family stress response membrane protein [Nucisporomicrobium flavum]